jgi:hypothetical protein
MATYPTGTYAPVAKATGNVIQASFFNDPESEIIAVENALLNGLAHPVSLTSTNGLTVGGKLSVGGPSTLTTLQAGASTLTTLQAGASTLTSLQVTGNSTFDGTVTITGSFLPTMPVCVLTHSTLIGVANGVATRLNWDTETVDAAGMHSTSVNSSRITFAASTGWYQVTLSVPWSANSSGAHLLRIRYNDTSGVLQGLTFLADVGTQDGYLSGLVRAASTADFIVAEVSQFGGSTASVTNISTVAALTFSAVLVSR